MRTIVFCLIVSLVMSCPKTEAAYAPLSSSFVPTTFEMDSKKSDVLSPSIYVPHKKVGFLKKLHYKIFQNRIKYLSNKLDEGTKPKTSGLSIVSLILGLIGVIGLFAGIGHAALLAALAAIITGIIALRKRKSINKGSRAMAIISLVLGGGLILLFVIFILSFGA